MSNLTQEDMKETYNRAPKLIREVQSSSNKAKMKARREAEAILEALQLEKEFRL